MKTNSQKKIIMVPFLFALFGLSPLFAQSAPTIETSKFDGGSSVRIVFPDNYSGRVETSCVNDVCTSTTTAFTEKDKKELMKKIEKQRKEMEDFWKKQQEIFDQLWKQSISLWDFGR